MTDCLNNTTCGLLSIYKIYSPCISDIIIFDDAYQVFNRISEAGSDNELQTPKEVSTADIVAEAKNEVEEEADAKAELDEELKDAAKTTQAHAVDPKGMGSTIDSAVEDGVAKTIRIPVPRTAKAGDFLTFPHPLNIDFEVRMQVPTDGSFKRGMIMEQALPPLPPQAFLHFPRAKPRGWAEATV